MLHNDGISHDTLSDVSISPDSKVDVSARCCRNAFESGCLFLVHIFRSDELCDGRIIHFPRFFDGKIDAAGNGFAPSFPPNRRQRIPADGTVRGTVRVTCYENTSSLGIESLPCFCEKIGILAFLTTGLRSTIFSSVNDAFYNNWRKLAQIFHGSLSG